VTPWPSDRRTFVSLGLQCVVNAFVYSTYVARLPDIRDEAGLSIAAMGLVMTIGNLAGLAAMFPSGAVIRRWGSKRVMVVSSVAYVLTLPVLGSSDSPAMLVAAVVAMMVTNAIVDVAVAMQSATFSARRHYPAMSRLSGLYSLGTVGGGVVATAIVAAGFDVSLHLLALAVALAVALVFVSPGLLPADERPAEKDDGPATSRTWIAVAVLALASALAVPLDIVPGEWATFRVTDDLGGAGSQAALAFVAFTVGMTGGRLAGDRATAHLGPARLLRGAVVLSVAGLALAASVPGHALVIAGFLLAGLGISVVSPLLTLAAGRTPGPAFTAMFVGNRVAGLLTPLAMGTLAGTPALSVGEAMIALVVPSGALLLLLGAAAVSVVRTRR
jgi:Major Facilitator Superfamily